MSTTRKHPRSMREAFKDADYASSVERTRVNGHRAVNWALAQAAGSGNKITAAHVAQHLKAAPCAVGMVEALAGLNPQNTAERERLWGQYRHLFAVPHPAAMTAVMNYCKEVTAQRVNAGELTLWHWGMKGGAA